MLTAKKKTSWGAGMTPKQTCLEDATEECISSWPIRRQLLQVTLKCPQGNSKTDPKVLQSYFIQVGYSHWLWKGRHICHYAPTGKFTKFDKGTTLLSPHQSWDLTNRAINSARLSGCHGYQLPSKMLLLPLGPEAALLFSPDSYWQRVFFLPTFPKLIPKLQKASEDSELKEFILFPVTLLSYWFITVVHYMLTVLT